VCQRIPSGLDGHTPVRPREIEARHKDTVFVANLVLSNGHWNAGAAEQVLEPRLEDALSRRSVGFTKSEDPPHYPSAPSAVDAEGVQTRPQPLEQFGVAPHGAFDGRLDQFLILDDGRQVDQGPDDAGHVEETEVPGIRAGQVPGEVQDDAPRRPSVTPGRCQLAMGGGMRPYSRKEAYRIS